MALCQAVSKLGRGWLCKRRSVVKVFLGNGKVLYLCRQHAEARHRLLERARARLRIDSAGLAALGGLSQHDACNLYGGAEPPHVTH